MTEQKNEAKSIEKPTAATIANPFAKPVDERTLAGAVAVESEAAIAREQGKLVIAKRFPRDPFRAFEKIREACKRKGLAEEAFYLFKRGGQNVTGPSIRLAEELARCWGNIEYGLRELSNDNGRTEMEAYAFDLEANVATRQQFVVHHIRDTREGAKTLTDQRDVYELGANMGARRLRSRILALLPADFVDAAVQVARATLAAKDAEEPMGERTKKMLDAFAQFGVKAAHIEAHLGHALDATTPDELLALKEIFSSLRDGGKVADYFGAPLVTAPTAPEQQTGLAAINAARDAVSAATAGTKPAAKTQRRMMIRDESAPAPAATSTPAPTPAPAPATTPAQPEPTREPGSDDGDPLFG